MVEVGVALPEIAQVLRHSSISSSVEYARVDIEADDDLVVPYGFRIPVISLDGVDRLEAPITHEDVRALAAELDGR